MAADDQRPRGPWRRQSGVFGFERGPGWPEPPEYALERGLDAPPERRDLGFVVSVLAAVFLLAVVAAVLAKVVGWV
jgi:hypothetical protein